MHSQVLQEPVLTRQVRPLALPPRQLVPSAFKNPLLQQRQLDLRAEVVT